MPRNWIVLTAQGVCLLIAAAHGNPTVGTVITVNTEVDVIAASDGLCSLREAVIASNNDLPSGGTAGECVSGAGSDTIVIPAGTFTLTIPGTGEDQAQTGDLDIYNSVEIQGAGQSLTVIDGNEIDRLLEIYTYPDVITVEISDLTLKNGLTTDDGGAVWNREVLTLTDLTVEGSSAGDRGGGIYNYYGELQLDHCLVDGNAASDSGGGVYDYGGVVTIFRTIVSRNSSGSSGGGIASDGTLSIRESTLAWNTGYRGGGLYTSDISTVYESTIMSNAVSDDGGGVYAYYGDATLRNTTVSGNSAAQVGGAIRCYSDSINLKNSTLFNNTASQGSALSNGCSVFVSNTVLQGTCDGSALLSQGGNIESPGSTCGLVQASDQVNVTTSALSLGPLADNGGPTLTHSPILPSAAVDLGLDGVCEDFDQRGFSRPEDGDGNGTPICDVGSVEYAVPPLFFDDFESGDTSAWSSTVE